MNLTPSEIRSRREFLIRHKEQEVIYARRFFNVLQRQYRAAAKQFERDGFFDPSIIRDDQLEPVYRRLYTINTIYEARKTWNESVIPVIRELSRRKALKSGMQKKDIIDDLADLLGFGRQGNIIQLWRQLLEDFLNVRILTRIRQVTDTTRERIARIIESGLNGGLSHPDITRKIRNETDINRNRAIRISRTEVTTALNQGKYLAVQSSNLVYEKGWSAHADSRTRDSHLAMLDADFIDLNETFIVGGSLMEYPGDSSHGAPAKEIVNCRCSLVFRVKRDADGLPIRKREIIEAI